MLFLDVETYSSDPAEEKGALEPFLARISCISWTEGEEVRTLSIRTTAEQEMIALPFGAMRQKDAAPIVTFNGHGFDLPILAIRGLALGLELPGLLVGAVTDKPWERQWHQDLRNVVTFGGAFRTGTLDQVCRCFGLPSPKASMTGAQAARLAYEVASGMADPDEMLAVEEYNAGDVRSLVQLWAVLKKGRLL
jgi:predicted PolB exonuclease-like 3'-5' exonuclease